MIAVKIEPIQPEHIEDFHRAYGTVAREHKYLRTLDARPLDRVRTFVLDNIANGFPQFDGTAGEDVVGWCDIIPMSLATEAHTGTLGMGLLPEYRGLGHGRQLLLMTLEAAQQFGLQRIDLTVHTDNKRAIALYESVGFQHEGVKRRALRIGGQFKDVAIMAKIDAALLGSD